MIGKAASHPSKDLIFNNNNNIEPIQSLNRRIGRPRTDWLETALTNLWQSLGTFYDHSITDIFPDLNNEYHRAAREDFEPTLPFDRRYDTRLHETFL